MSARGLIVTTALGLLLAAAPARALELEVAAAPEVAFEGEPIEVAIDLVDMDEDVTRLELQADPRLTVDGPRGGARRTQIVNGVRTEAVRVQWVIAPPPPGEYRLGPVRVTTRSGKTRELALDGPLRVLQRAPAGSARLEVRAPAGGPVGYPFRVIYTILTAEPRAEGGGGDLFELALGGGGGTFGLSALSLALLQGDLPRKPVPADPDRPAQRLSAGRDLTLLVQPGLVERDGVGWHALSFALELTPRRPGPIDLAAQAELEVLSGSRRVRDLFGRVREVAGKRELKLESEPARYEVEPLPRRGRPAGFSGAVGRFTIEARTDATQVNAFDPVEVTITVRGEGLLEDVVLPPWHELPELTQGFQIASDADPGKSSEDGRAKVFTKTFRPRSAEVRALPALPLPYYDPEARAYRVAWSEPIPLEVSAVETVGAADALGGAATPSAGGEAARPGPIAARGGVPANYLELGDEVATFAPPARLDPLLALGAAAPPLALLVLAALPWLRRRLARPPTPLEQALAALAPGEADLDAARAAFGVYAAGRLGLSGALTPHELEQALRARVVPPEVVTRVVAHWEALERARFAGGGQAPPGSAALLKEVDACL